MRTAALALGLASGPGGCFTADLDTDAAGAFACSADEDCPDPGRCVNQRCQQEDAPELTIESPEDEQPFTYVQDGHAIPVTVTIGGSLELHDPADGSEHVFGEGHVLVTIDGVAVATIVEGTASVGLQIAATIANQPGPHRIAGYAHRNDGVRYDNPESTATRLVWVADGRPHVAIASPWPHTAFPTDDTAVDVVLATLDFDMVPPDGTITPGSGHAHVYYGFAPEQCTGPDPTDECPYLAIVAASNEPVAVSLPARPAERSTLMAILRFGDHSPYTVPIGAETLAFVADAIEVDRVD